MYNSSKMKADSEDDVFGAAAEGFSEEEELGVDEKFKCSNEYLFGGAKGEYLEAKKYDPSKKNRCSDEDMFFDYESIAAGNPFKASATYREKLANKEKYFPPKPTLRPTVQGLAELDPDNELTILPQRAASPPFQTRDTSHEIEKSDLEDLYSYKWAGNPENVVEPYVKPLRIHKRSASNPQFSPSPEVTPPHNAPPMQVRHKVSKSLSDPTLLHQNPPPVDNATKRKPSPINVSPYRQSLGLSDRENQRLSTITEQEDPGSYKLQVARTLGSPTKVTRSPLKKFFGEGGLLGRSPSKKDKPDPRFKKTGVVHWGGKVKQYITDITKDISDSVPRVDLLSMQSHPPLVLSKFPVSLQPYEQGNLYFQLELLLSNETNRFLTAELEADRVSVDSIQKIAEAWALKGRPQVLDFRYDLLTQRELVMSNTERLKFGGIHALNRAKLHSALAAWRVLANEISLRTFCQPDSAVKKHLFDAERVLEIVDAGATSMLAFQELRDRTLDIISREEKYKEEKRKMNGREVAWSPRRFGGEEAA